MSGQEKNDFKSLIDNQLPPQFQDRRLKFILLEPGSKEPLRGVKWESVNYCFDDAQLVNHRRKGGNYAPIAGSNFVFVDTDTKELANAIRKGLPPTFTTLSPGHNSPHFYFEIEWDSAPRTIPLSIKRQDKTEENVGHVKAANGYVVGPGSVHPNGQRYEILDDRPIAKITEQQLLEVIVPFMAHKAHDVELEVAKKEHPGIDIQIAKLVDLSKLRRQGQEYFGPHPVHGSESGRNFWLNPTKNEWCCFRHMSGGGPLQYLAVMEGLIQCELSRPGALRDEAFKLTLHKARQRGLIALLSEDVQPYELVDNLLDEICVRTFADTEEILLYKDGVHVLHGEATLKKRIQQKLHENKLDNKAKINFVRECIELIKRRTYVDRKKFDADPFILNLKNGLFDIRTGALHAHSAEYLSLIQLPVSYDPSVDCPKFRKFLSEVLCPDDIKVTQEFCGYILWKDMPAAKAVMFIGDGSNGKSTVINVIKSLVGLHQISSRGLQELEIHRFAKADLYAKLANLYADLPVSALQSVGTFKMLTGRDPITAEFKFKNSFSFINYAKLVFSTNKVPEVYDDTGAFFRRWLLISFPNTFSGINENRNLLEELTTEEELSGVMNWALEGLRRLRENGWRFSDSRTTEQIKEEYIRRSSPIRAFLIDCLKQVPDGHIVKREVYSQFCVYCRKMQLPIVTSDTFWKNLPKHLKFEEARVEVTEEGKKRRPRAVLGYLLKPEADWGKKEDSDALDKEEIGQAGHDQAVQSVHGFSNLREQVLEAIRNLSLPSPDDFTEYITANSDWNALEASQFVSGMIQSGKLIQHPDGKWIVNGGQS